MSLASKYRKSLDQRWCLRFNTVHPRGDAHDGIVVHIARTFIVLREERDFELDGLIVLPKSAMKSCRDNKFEACHNLILRESGAAAESGRRRPSLISTRFSGSRSIADTVIDSMRT
jgi:hypothetical protein